jgi:hypothetical protein
MNQPQKDFTYLKQSSSEIQSVEWWLPEAEERQRRGVVVSWGQF